MIYAGYLDTVPYREALDQQRSLHGRVARADSEEYLLLLEHPQVLTRGFRERDNAGLRTSEERIASLGIEIVQSDRGGQWTYHGPGQLVAYFILNIARRRLALRRFVGLLEESMIGVLGSWGIAGARSPGRPGVWVADRKIGFVGLAARKGITHHGVAMNIDVDLEPFDLIVPCGMDDCRVTSIREQTGETPPIRNVAARLTERFQEAIGEPVRTLDQREMQARISGAIEP